MDEANSKKSIEDPKAGESAGGEAGGEASAGPKSVDTSEQKKNLVPHFASPEEQSKTDTAELKADVDNSGKGAPINSYGDQNGKDKKMSLLSRLFPTQTVMFIVIGVIFVLGVGAVCTVIPMNGKKQKILQGLRNLGIEASIDGNVYFNPFVMSFEFHDVKAKVKQVMTSGENSCASSLDIRSNNVQFRVFSKEVSTAGAQVFLKTDGNMSKLYDFVSSMSRSSDISGFRIFDSAISVSPCDAGEDQRKQGKEGSSGDDDDDDDGAALVTVPFEEATFKGKKDFAKLGLVLTIEGERISIEYEKDGNLEKSFAFNSSFANLTFNLDIDDEEKSSTNVGTYALNVADGKKLVKIFGVSRSAPYYSILSRGNVRIGGKMAYDPNFGLSVADELLTSYGNGALRASVPLKGPAQAIVDVHFDQINVSDAVVSRDDLFDTSAKYLGIPNIIRNLLISKDHRLLFSVDKVIDKGGELKKMSFGYGVVKSALKVDQTFVSVETPSFEVRSVHFDSRQRLDPFPTGHPLLKSKRSDGSGAVDASAAAARVASMGAVGTPSNNASVDVASGPVAVGSGAAGGATAAAGAAGSNAVVPSSTFRWLAPIASSGGGQSGAAGSVIESEAIVPIAVNGTNICELKDFIGSLFLGGQRGNEDEGNTADTGCDGSSFSGQMKFFVDYRNKNSGLKDLHISSKGGGNINGEYVLVKSANKGGMMENLHKISFALSGVDVSGMFPKDWVRGLFSIFKQGQGNSVVFNFANQSSTGIIYAVNLDFKDIVYRGSNVDSFHLSVEKNSTRFSVADMTGSSGLFKGSFRLLFDIGTDEPVLNVVSNIDSLDLDALLGLGNYSSPANDSPVVDASAPKMSTALLLMSKEDSDKLLSVDEKMLLNDNSSVSPDAAVPAAVSSSVSAAASVAAVPTLASAPPPSSASGLSSQGPDASSSDSSLQDVSKMASAILDAASKVVVAAVPVVGSVADASAPTAAPTSAPTVATAAAVAAPAAKSVSPDLSLSAPAVAYGPSGSPDSIAVPSAAVSAVSAPAVSAAVPAPAPDGGVSSSAGSPLVPQGLKAPVANVPSASSVLQSLKDKAANNVPTEQLPYFSILGNPNRQIPFVDDLFGVIKINANNIKVAGRRIGNLSVDCEITNSNAQINQLSMSDSEGGIDLNGRIKLTENAKIALRGSGGGVPVKYFLRLFWGNSHIDGRSNVSITLESYGKSFANVISNMAGKIVFNARNLTITHPNVGILSNLLMSPDPAKKGDVSKLLAQPGVTTFTTGSGKIMLQNGAIRVDDLVVKSVGYSGIVKCLINPLKDEIDICKATFVLLSNKPWEKSRDPNAKFVKVPMSIGIIGKMSNPSTAIATERVVEYMDAVSQYNTVLKSANAMTKANAAASSAPSATGESVSQSAN